MSTQQDLARLLGELKAAGSPLRRMKLLGGAWRTLRRLSPKARKDLAAQVGIDGAEEILEQLSGSDRRLSPAALLSALEAIRSSTDPDDLRRTLSDLRDPAGRRALLDRGLDAVARKLAGPEEAAPLSPAPPTALDAVDLQPRPDRSERAVPTSPATTAAAAAVAAGAAAAGAKSRTTPARRHAETRARQRPAVAPPDPVNARPAPPTRPTSPAPPAPRAAVPVPAARDVPAPPPEPSSRPAPRSRPRRPEGATPPATPPSRLVDRLLAEDHLTDRFRVLRDHVEDARGLPLEELRRLIEAFPSEWARRRALTSLIDRHIPQDLRHAIYLIEALDSRAAQRWCVARILHGWPLADHERNALLERHGGFIRRAG